jgi:hypothetical protein
MVVRALRRVLAEVTQQDLVVMAVDHLLYRRELHYLLKLEAEVVEAVLVLMDSTTTPEAGVV